MSGENESQRVRRLYRQRAEDRAVQSIRWLMCLPADQQLAAGARAVADAAGVLAVITTVFTDPHSDIGDKFNDQITALLVLARAASEGVPRDRLRLWTAHWTGSPHLCDHHCVPGSPTSRRCGIGFRVGTDRDEMIAASLEHTAAHATTHPHAHRRTC